MSRESKSDLPVPKIRLIKKYPNRRLYDTETSSYIVLPDIKKMALEYQKFEIRDAKSGEDITRSVLLQIILEEENCHSPIFSCTILLQMIRFYGNATQNVIRDCLEKNIECISQLQQKLEEQAKLTCETKSSFSPSSWATVFNFQQPLQGFMKMYLEQMQKVFFQAQEQMQSMLHSTPTIKEHQPNPPVGDGTNGQK